MIGIPGIFTSFGRGRERYGRFEETCGEVVEGVVRDKMGVG